MGRPEQTEEETKCIHMASTRFASHLGVGGRPRAAALPAARRPGQIPVKADRGRDPCRRRRRHRHHGAHDDGAGAGGTSDRSSSSSTRPAAAAPRRSAYAASRPKDGHTILLITQTHLLTMLQGKRRRREGRATSSALARATEDPQVLMVGKSSPYKTAKEFIDAAKTKAMKYGTTQRRQRRPHRRASGSPRRQACRSRPSMPVPRRRRHRHQSRRRQSRGALLNYAEAESQIKAGEVRRS